MLRIMLPSAHGTRSSCSSDQGDDAVVELPVSLAVELAHRCVCCVCTCSLVTCIVSDIMAGISICCALADPANVWFTPIDPHSSAQLLALACMVYSCCPCSYASDAIPNTGLALILHLTLLEYAFVCCSCVASVCGSASSSVAFFAIRGMPSAFNRAVTHPPPPFSSFSRPLYCCPLPR